MENDNIITAVKDLVAENTKLREELALVKGNNERLRLRESLYQKELGKTKTELQRLFQAIDTTPHSRDAEYQQLAYGEECQNEEVS